MSRDGFLYLRLYNDIKGKIEEGVYPEGFKMPSEEELKAKFNVSVITVKKALNMLKDEGLLQRIPGVGTFVKERTHTVKKEDIRENEIPSISSTSSNKIGIVLEHVSSSFGLDLMYKLDCLAEEKGFKTITRFSYYNRDKETEEIDFLMNLNISALIVMPCHGLYYNPKILKLILEGFPVVVIDKKLEGISVPSVRTDNIKAIKVLVQELWEQGCRNMGFISSEIIGTSSLQERRAGFYEAVSEFSIPSFSECALVFDKNIYEHSPTKENVDLVVEYLEEHRGILDGIICAEYSLLPAIMKASELSSVKLGDDVKVCCVDGLQGLNITHMKQNELEMAEKIIELLVDQIDGVIEKTDFLVPAILVNHK